MLNLNQCVDDIVMVTLTPAKVVAQRKRFSQTNLVHANKTQKKREKKQRKKNKEKKQCNKNKT